MVQEQTSAWLTKRSQQKLVGMVGPAPQMVRQGFASLIKVWNFEKWLGDNFENGSGGVFQESLKDGVRFQTFLKKGSIFKLFLKKYHTQGPRPGWTGARTQAPTGWGPFSNSV